MYELLTKDIDIAVDADVEKLRDKIPEIKKIIFMSAKEVQ